MAINQSELSELVLDRLLPAWQREKERLHRIDRWYRWDPDQIMLPRSATREAKMLRDLARVPWLGLVVTSCAQCMYVDGYRSALDPIANATTEQPDPLKPPELPSAPAATDQPTGPWRYWLANGLDRRQMAIHRAALAYGYSFVTVLPGEDPLTGEDMPVIRGVSPRRMWAVYEDPENDDWPKYALQILRHDSDTHEAECRLFDDTFVYDLVVNGPNVQPGTKPLEVVGSYHHGAGVCPVVRYCNELDLDGRTSGEIEPHIPLAAKINKTSYDRILAQHFNSWKVRYICGIAAPDDEEEANRKKLQLAQDDLLVAEDPDTKFGSLPETTLQGFIQAHQADVEALAAVTQTPTHELTGQLVNLSAEALAAARASQTQKIHERQKSFGASHVQALRLASALDKDDQHALDITGRVTWQDTTIRSLSQAADALGKAAQMLQVPVTALWGRIPGVEKQDVAEWIKLAQSMDPMERWQFELERQSHAQQQPAQGSAQGAPAEGPPA